MREKVHKMSLIITDAATVAPDAAAFTAADRATAAATATNLLLLVQP